MIGSLLIGKTLEYSPIRITEGEQYKHILVTGMPGGGKTALLANMWKQHCLFPTAKILIDPSGSFAEQARAMSGKNAVYCSIDEPRGL